MDIIKKIKELNNRIRNLEIRNMVIGPGLSPMDDEIPQLDKEKLNDEIRRIKNSSEEDLQ